GGGSAGVRGGDRGVARLIPSGVLHPGKRCVLGDGMVIDPSALLDEIGQLRARGLLARGELLVGQGAHVILPYHKLIEGLREERAQAAGRAIGTTRRGIGPAYEAKAARRGVRVRDLATPGHLRDLVEQNLDELAPLVVHLGGTAPDRATVDRWIDDALAAGAQLATMVGDASREVARHVAAGHHVLFEGAQGSLLD